MVKIKWTVQAVNDIENIAEFIAKDSQNYAIIQTKRFFDSVLVLKSNPSFGRVVPEMGSKIIREIILGNYRIIYRIASKESVDIITVHHSKRQLKTQVFKK